MNLPCPRDVRELDELISRPSPGAVAAVERLAGDFTVLGAAGKMGFHLCRMLQQALSQLGRTSRVRAVSRFGSVRSRVDFEAAGLEVVAADLSTPDGVSTVPLTENVFFLAGVKFGTSHDADLLRRMNVEMPGLVAERFCDSRIAALSTGCVYSFTSPASGGSTEHSPTDPPGAYAQSCLGRERAFVEASERHGTRSSLVRLNYSIDLRYGVLVDIAQKVLAGQPVDVSMGCVNVIWQGDALAHTIQSLEHAAAPPFVINVTGPGILRVRDLAEAFGERFGRPVQLVGQEAPTAWLNNAARAHQLFGAPAVSLDQMLDWTTEWLQQGGELLGKPTHFENREGRY